MNGKDYKRSPVLIIVMSLFVLVGLYRIAVNIIAVSNYEILTAASYIKYYFPQIPYINPRFVNLPFQMLPQIRAAINIAEISFGIFLLCICMIKLKKWAFKAYVVLTAAEAIMQLISVISDIITYKPYMISPISLISYYMYAFIIKGILLLVVYLFVVKNPPIINGRYRPRNIVTGEPKPKE